MDGCGFAGRRPSAGFYKMEAGLRGFLRHLLLLPNDYCLLDSPAIYSLHGFTVATSALPDFDPTCATRINAGLPHLVALCANDHITSLSR